MVPSTIRPFPETRMFAVEAEPSGKTVGVIPTGRLIPSFTSRASPTAVLKLAIQG